MAFLAFIAGGLIISFSIRACVRHHTVLDSVGQLPSNALLLTDRYHFAFKHPNGGVLSMAGKMEKCLNIRNRLI